MDKQVQAVPFVVHEADMARAERTNKRLWFVVILQALIIVSLCVGFFCYESQFEDVTQTIEATQEGGDVNIVGGGNVNYGTESKNNN